METLLACDWLFVSSFLLDDVFTSDPLLSFSAGNQICGSLYDIFRGDFGLCFMQQFYTLFGPAMNKAEVQLSMAILNKIAKPFPTRPKGSIVIAQFSNYKVRTGDLFYVRHNKTLSFSLVAEALTGLIYLRPLGENSSFQS